MTAVQLQKSTYSNRLSYVEVEVDVILGTNVVYVHSKLLIASLSVRFNLCSCEVILGRASC